MYSLVPVCPGNEVSLRTFFSMHVVCNGVRGSLIPRPFRALLSELHNYVAFEPQKEKQGTKVMYAYSQESEAGDSLGTRPDQRLNQQAKSPTN